MEINDPIRSNGAAPKCHTPPEATVDVLLGLVYPVS